MVKVEIFEFCIPSSKLQVDRRAHITFTFYTSIIPADGVMKGAQPQEKCSDKGLTIRESRGHYVSGEKGRCGQNFTFKHEMYLFYFICLCGRGIAH